MSTPSVGTSVNESPNSAQVGGDHYHTDDNKPQVWDMIERNNMAYLEGCVVKYILRWRKKGGAVDIQKARHYVEKLIAEDVAGRRTYLKPIRAEAAKRNEGGIFDWSKWCFEHEVKYPESAICMRLSTWYTQAELRNVISDIDKIEVSAPPVINSSSVVLDCPDAIVILGSDALDVLRSEGL